MRKAYKMEKGEKKEILKAANFVQDSLKTAITDSSIGGERVSKEKYGKIVEDQLRSYRDQKIISGYELGGTNILWETWSWQKKLYWFWKMKLGFGEKELERYLDIENFIISREVDESEECRDFICEIVSQYYEKYFKWWYETNPKSILLNDFAILPLASFNCVVCSGAINLDAKKEENYMSSL